MTPILVRPVREQLEHDRVIRLLQQRWRRKYAVGINQGSETAASVTVGDFVLYPDVVLAPLDKPNKPEIVVEVETGESVNNLEAMAEWARMSQLKAEFHLYVPAGSVDPARRLCTEHKVLVAEIWTYHPIGDQMRFNMAYKAPETPRGVRRSAAEAPARPAARKGAPTRTSAGANGSTARKSAPARRVAKPAAPEARGREESAGQARPRPEEEVAAAGSDRTGPPLSGPSASKVDDGPRVIEPPAVRQNPVPPGIY